MRRNNYNLNLDLADFNVGSTPYLPYYMNQAGNGYQNVLNQTPAFIRNAMAQQQYLANSARGFHNTVQPNAYPSSPLVRPIIADPPIQAYNQPNVYPSSPLVRPIVTDPNTYPANPVNRPIVANPTSNIPNVNNTGIVNAQNNNRLDNKGRRTRKRSVSRINENINQTGTVKTSVKPNRRIRASDINNDNVRLGQRVNYNVQQQLQKPNFKYQPTPFSTGLKNKAKSTGSKIKLGIQNQLQKPNFKYQKGGMGTAWLKNRLSSLAKAL